jgi:SET domain-containing protein
MNVIALKGDCLTHSINCLITIHPSKIEGVGIFAISEIKKGDNPFSDYQLYQVTKMEFDLLSSEMRDLIIRHGELQSDGSYYIVEDLSNPNLSIYVNHSLFPNLESDQFTALRTIHPGEELTINYDDLPARRS